ncbi:Ovarian cancer-associated protein 2 [Borealophlyctis nickersoniae]|nr:Ovarian cancer-associated protein 2 [Borealophlyctis nickersoniae]
MVSIHQAFHVRQSTDISDSGEGPRAWFFYEQDGQVYRHYDESIRFLQEFWSTNGPFDALLGFSQGATMSVLLAATLPPHLPKPKFLFLSGGYAPHTTPSHNVLSPTKKLDIPSLHVIGRADTVVPASWSEALVTCFEDRGDQPVVVVHHGGHYIPTDVENRKVYREFVMRFTTRSPSLLSDSTSLKPSL